jgi:hypothetical protein
MAEAGELLFAKQLGRQDRQLKENGGASAFERVELGPPKNKPQSLGIERGGRSFGPRHLGERATASACFMHFTYQNKKLRAHGAAEGASFERPLITWECHAACPLAPQNFR